MRAELAEMGGDELGVQQGEAAEAQAGDEVDEGDLGGVAGAAEHALTKKGAAEDDTVEAADEAAVLPDLDAVGVAAGVQRGEQAFDVGG